LIHKLIFQALPDSRSNDSEVPATSATYAVSDWRKFEAAQVADKWKQYCEDLYHDEEGKGIDQEYWEHEPPPLHLEVVHAIRQTASRKATGPDDVTEELFKAAGETVLN